MEKYAIIQVLLLEEIGFIFLAGILGRQIQSGIEILIRDTRSKSRIPTDRNGLMASSPINPNRNNFSR